MTPGRAENAATNSSGFWGSFRVSTEIKAGLHPPVSEGTAESGVLQIPHLAAWFE
jgi:hypothetical protein